MSTRTNPFADDPERASVFELGYFAGFHDPAGNDSDFRPFAPELLDIYVAGADAGREDAHAGPPANSSKQWADRAELRAHADSSEDMKEHLLTFAIFKALEVLTRKALFGLFDLVITALGIQGNVTPEQLRAIDDGFEAGATDPPRDAVVYVAACSRTDHPLVLANVSPDGSWLGTPRDTVEEALRDLVHHDHREGFLARCDANAGTCSTVWVAKDQ
jgi:hypothetical protein